MSRHLIMFPAFVGVAAAGFMALAEQGHLSTWKSWWSNITQPEATRASSDRMKLELLDQVNYVRIAAKNNPVKIDPELQDLLDAYQKTDIPEDLDTVVDQVQNAIPRYYRVTVSSASQRTIYINRIGSGASAVEIIAAAGGVFSRTRLRRRA